MKKTLSLALVVLMIVSAFTLFAMNVSADDEYTLVDGVFTLKADLDKGYSTSANIDKYPWAAQRDQITKVVVEDGVTLIGKFAFTKCVNLTTVELGKDVTTINKSAFSGCTSLETVTFKAPLVTAGESIFEGSTLTKVTLASQSEIDFKKVVAASSKNVGAEYPLDTCEYEVVGEVVHEAPETVTLILTPEYGGMENWGTPKRTQLIVGINTVKDADKAQVRKDVQTALKGGFASLALTIKDETDGKYYYIPEYFFDCGSEFYNVGEFMRFVLTAYDIYPVSGHAYTVFIKITDKEYGDVLYVGKSDDGAFDNTANLKDPVGAIVWDEIPHGHEEPTENPIVVGEVQYDPITLEKIVVYADGMENWPSDDPHVQILFCPYPWDSSVYKKGFQVTVNMKANDDSSDDTFTAKVTSTYDPGDWGICRLEPGQLETPWLPVKDVEYTCTISFDDRTGNTLSATVTAEDDDGNDLGVAVYVLHEEPADTVDPSTETPTETETPEPPADEVSPFSAGMENWPNSPNKGDYDAVTQILFCVDPWDNDFYKNYAGKEVTVTMTDPDGQSSTFTLPVATVYAGGTWGILRVEPCLMETPWVPEKDVAYTATLTYEKPDGTTVTVQSSGTYTLNVDPIVPEGQEPTTTETPTETPTETETPVITNAVEPFNAGMENWPNSPNKGDYDAVTQILFCIDPWDNDHFKSIVGEDVTVTMTDPNGKSATFTLPIATVYAGGDWGIVRVEPCLMETPWVPEKGVAYTAKITYINVNGETVTVESSGTYTLNVDPIVPVVEEPTTETPTATTTETPVETGDNTALFIVLALIAVLGAAVVVSKKVFSK